MQGLLRWLNPAEIYRSLGCAPQDAPEQTRREVSRLLEVLTPLCAPRWVCAEFALERKEAGVALAGTSLVLPGRDIAQLLDGCDACMLMAATLGIEVDRAIDGAQRRAIAEAVVMDAIASALIEACCDHAQEKLIAGPARLLLTRRFSPGYGDLPLSLQSGVLAVLNAGRRIGLHASQNHLLIPRKSVTAVMGLAKDAAMTTEPDACAGCRLAEDCNLRKAGKRCGR